MMLSKKLGAVAGLALLGSIAANDANAQRAGGDPSQPAPSCGTNCGGTPTTNNNAASASANSSTKVYSGSTHVAGSGNVFGCLVLPYAAVGANVMGFGGGVSFSREAQFIKACGTHEKVKAFVQSKFCQVAELGATTALLSDDTVAAAAQMLQGRQVMTYGFRIKGCTLSKQYMAGFTPKPN